MKFLQVHHFYHQYLHQFYEKRPQLRLASFSEQMNALVGDSFGGSHLFAPYLGALGYDSQLIVANAEWAQQAWAREVGIPSLDQDLWMFQALKLQIDMIRPDILYISHPILFHSNFLRALDWKPHLIMGWRAAEIPDDCDFTEFDLMLSSHTSIRRELIRAGARRVEHFLPGFPEFVAEEVRNEQKQSDLIFAGQISPEHSYRTECLDYLVEEPKRFGRELDLRYHLLVPSSHALRTCAGLNRGSLWGMEMQRALKQSSVALNVMVSFANGEAGNMRLFETTGTGVMLLTDHNDNLNRYFEVGKELDSFRSKAEMLEKIYYYLDHPSEREEIAKRGQERCLNEHGMTVRVHEFHDIIQRHLARPIPDFSRQESWIKPLSEEKQEKPPGGRAQLYMTVQSLVNQGRDQEALQLIVANLSSNVVLSYVLALLLARNGQMDQATQAIEQFLKIFPKHHSALILQQQILRGEVPAAPVPIETPSQSETQSRLFVESLNEEPTAELSVETTGRVTPPSRGRVVVEVRSSQCEAVESPEMGTVVAQLERALSCLDRGEPSKALTLLIEAKKYRIPVRDLDYMRGIAFLSLEQYGDALTALQEELWHFPDNKPALELLSNIEQEGKSPDYVPDGEEYAEFRSILEKVRPFTMLPAPRLLNLYTLAKQVCESDLPGDFVECGVAGGGSTALLAFVIEQYSLRPRRIYACDTFEGMPAPSEHDTLSGQAADATGWGTGTCAAPQSNVLEISRQLGVSELVHPVKGYFCDTLPSLRNEISEIALLHADCDWYEATLDVMNNLYELVVPGGIIQVDDYGYWDGMRKAVHEFESSLAQPFVINTIEGAAWFTRPPS